MRDLFEFVWCKWQGHLAAALAVWTAVDNCSLICIGAPVYTDRF